MADRIVETEQARTMLMKFIEQHALPFTASIVSGKHRTTRQNKLQRLWCREIAEQLGDCTAEEIRGHIKLHHGVPILREENEAFRLRYDEVVGRLSYVQQLAIMQAPLSLPVTSIMTTKQKTRFLDDVHRAFSERGVILTDPETLRRAA